MKKFKKFLTAVCTAGLLFSLSAAGVSAQEYTYTVTFDAGNQGTIAGTEGLAVNNRATGSSYQVGVAEGKIVVSGLRAQDIVTFNPQAGAVSLAGDSKYYVKGVRQSGRDNNSVASSSFRVTGDADYVVAYGIKGSQVGYTVNYQDSEGRALADSRQYYGNIGDKPVVAHIYIENYTPQALALTRTLSSNEAENVFTFVYTQEETEVITRPGGTVTETVTETVTQPGTTTGDTGTTGTTGTTTGDTGTTGTTTGDTGTTGTTTGDTGTTGTTGTTTGGDTGTTGTTTGGDTGTTGTTTGGDTGTTGTTTGGDAAPAAATGGDTGTTAGTTAGGQTTDIQEDAVPQANSDVIDLDEEKTPLANVEIDKEEVEKGMPVAVGVGIAVVAVAGLGGLVWFLRKMKKS